MDVFFVLSGFLITGILIRQWDAQSRLSLGSFWLRRARRLRPHYWCSLRSWVSRLVALHTSASQWRSEMLAGLSYTTNWFQILTRRDYFAEFEDLSPLQHTWSLSIEEQFYLLLALFLAMLLPRMAAGTAPCHGVRQRWRSVHVQSVGRCGHGPGRVGVLRDGPTDSGATGGCVLAVLVRGNGLSGAGRRDVTILGPAALAALLVLMWRPPATMFYGGFLAVAALAACVIWAATAEGPVASVLAFRPLVAIGVVSYGVYLWHWPVFLMLQAQDGRTPVARQIWSVVLTLAIATGSYWIVRTDPPPDSSPP